MPMTFVKPEELDSYVGKSLEPSEWLTIDQERICLLYTSDAADDC